MLPRWNHTYDMQRSTIVMPCNTSGPLDPEFFSQFGIVDVDWSHMKHQWANTKPMDSSGLMVKQAQSLRGRNPNCRCEKTSALARFSTEKAIICQDRLGTNTRRVDSNTPNARL
jgi:hypothetical protein